MTSMTFAEFEQLQAENRRLRRENEELKSALKEILKLEAYMDRWGGHITQSGQIAQRVLVDARPGTD